MPLKHGKCGTSEYLTWGGMINRTSHASQRGFNSLQSHGVKVCDAWRTFEGFYADMGDKPNDEMVLTRLDPHADYCPANCIWAEPGVGQHNDRLRRNNTIGVKGVYHTSRGKYQAAITIDSKRIHLGTFDTLDEAAGVRKQAEGEYWQQPEGEKNGTRK